VGGEKLKIIRDSEREQVTETGCGGDVTFDVVFDSGTVGMAVHDRSLALADGVAELPLSPREKELLLEVCKGRTNAAIARALGISPATVKKHLEHIYEKLGVSGRVAALARALATRISIAIGVSYASVVSSGLPVEVGLQLTEW
jgi:DNA-binding CsgD family transcriptional regulator